MDTSILQRKHKNKSINLLSHSFSKTLKTLCRGRGRRGRRQLEPTWIEESCAGSSWARCRRCCSLGHAVASWGTCRGCVVFAGWEREWAAVGRAEQRGASGFRSGGEGFTGETLTVKNHFLDERSFEITLLEAYCRMLVLSFCMNTWL